MLHISLIGCGRWGRNILRDLLSLGCDVAVADPRSARCMNPLGKFFFQPRTITTSTTAPGFQYVSGSGVRFLLSFRMVLAICRYESILPVSRASFKLPM